MKVGIFNRYWATMGGGEQNAASYAAYFAKRHDVELIGTEYFDVEHLAQTLGRTEIAELPVRIIGSHASAVTEVSRDYDLFVTHSYLSDDYSLSPLGIYVCMFPQPLERTNSSNLQVRTIDKSLSQSEYFDRITINQHSSIEIKNRLKDRITFVSSGAQGEIKVFSKGVVERQIDSLVTRQTPTLHTLSIPKGKTTLRFFPTTENESDSHLTLDSLRTSDGRRAPWESQCRTISPGTLSFVQSYNAVLSISRYTSQWVQTRWSSRSAIHYPAVGLREWDARIPKEKIILSVGRFFSENHGHSKRQLQLVEAFKTLVDRGLEEWRLVLVGGCDTDNRDYALKVKECALGYPIEVLLNSDKKTLDEQFQKASIYWHATGLGMNLEAFPEKAEHFGIAPVEAMSAGCIPILFGTGGTAELIEDGVSGFLFHNLEQLIEKTSNLVKFSSEDIDAFRGASILRSQMFRQQRFEDELDLLMETISGKSK